MRLSSCHLLLTLMPLAYDHQRTPTPDLFMTNWETIVANEGPAVWRTLWRLLADREDVEDCFQETFVAALKVARLQTVQCWPALLCSLATARAMDVLRKRYRQGGRAGNRTEAKTARARVLTRLSTFRGESRSGSRAEHSSKWPTQWLTLGRPGFYAVSDKEC